MADIKMITVRVLRAFYYLGKPIKVNTEVPLPAIFAKEVCAAGKAEILPAPAEAEPDSRPPSTPKKAEPEKAKPEAKAVKPSA